MHKDGFLRLQGEGNRAINKQKYLKLFRESEGFFQNGTRKIGCLCWLFFTTYIEGGGFMFLYYNRECAAQSENTGKDGFGTVWNWRSLLISHLLLKRIRAEKEHESSLLKSKERFLMKFKDNTWDSFLQAQNGTPCYKTLPKLSALSLLLGYVAINKFFPGFTRGVKLQKTFQLLTL